MAFFNQRLHITVEEGQQQRTDMRTVDVGICHNNNLAITCLVQIKVIADTAAESGNHIANFFTAQHLIKTCLFNIKDFTAQRQNSLEITVTSLLGTAACRVTFDQINLGILNVTALAVSQLAGKSAQIHSVLTAGKLARLACCQTGACSNNSLFHQLFGNLRIFLHKLGQSIADQVINDRHNLAVAQLNLRLAFKLWVLHLQAQNCS